MKKKILCFLLLPFALMSVNAQNENEVLDQAKAVTDALQKKVDEVAAAEKAETPKNWKLSGVMGLNFSQAAFKNWAGGGVNTVALSAYLNAGAYYKKNKITWDNDLALEYGMLYDKEDFKKNVDKIDITSKFGFQVAPKLSWSTLVNAKSQFANGYDYDTDPYTKVSHFGAPAYLLLSTGIDWKPDDHFSLYFSPATGKFTFVEGHHFLPKYDEEGKLLPEDELVSWQESYGFDKDKRDKHARGEFGTYLKLQYKRDLCENVNLATKADFFTAYTHDFGNIDVDWEVILSMKVNKFLTATLTTELKYDDDVKFIDDKGESHGARIQFKELLGIGLMYKF